MTCLQWQLKTWGFGLHHSCLLALQKIFQFLLVPTFVAMYELDSKCFWRTQRTVQVIYLFNSIQFNIRSQFEFQTKELTLHVCRQSDQSLRCWQNLTKRFSQQFSITWKWERKKLYTKTYHLLAKQWKSESQIHSCLMSRAEKLIFFIKVTFRPSSILTDRQRPDDLTLQQLLSYVLLDWT